ncbi:MAG: 4a-hydroxytetrahydrobiopterin dehydratase, partial [Candidatus Competibacteraceae bacterium]|nr:4a-hydroxytetrahydrobiopterin dehydratase [Candidatus Competibacteraceae bacterium]
FYTHKIGGLHENDFIMAAKINTLYIDEYSTA